MKKLNTIEFIERSKKVHNNKYDYSKVEYVGSHLKVCIICPEHGEFWQRPTEHLKGRGCSICGGSNRLKPEEFMCRSREVHGDIYDYSKMVYKNFDTKITLIHKDCGSEFMVTPNSHLNQKVGCPCFYHVTKEEFIRRSKEMHGDTYDYSQIEYVNSFTKVKIICKKHGGFWQRPFAHWGGHGCSKCNRGVKINTKGWIEKARKVHGDKYDYSKVDYVIGSEKICIICPSHGEFWQEASSHLTGRGCQKCYNEARLSNTSEFINKAKIAHGEKYDYSKVEYVGYQKKVCITCPNHGEFWQAATSHLGGQGCPRCKQSKMEVEVIEILERNNIKYMFQKKFNWLRYRKKLSLDFYLPDYNIAIECQGIQHFKPIDYFGGEETFKGIQKRDRVKYELCRERGIQIIYYNSKKDFENLLRGESEILDVLRKIEERKENCS